MGKQVTITVTRKGQVHFEAENYVGTSCEADTVKLAEVLRSTSYETGTKPEYYESEALGEKNLNRGW